MQHPMNSAEYFQHNYNYAEIIMLKLFNNFFFWPAVFLLRTLYHCYRGISLNEELNCLAFLRLDIPAMFCMPSISIEVTENRNYPA